MDIRTNSADYPQHSHERRRNGHGSRLDQEPILRTLSRRILPASFMMLFLLAGTVVLVYTITLHQAIPPVPAIAVAIAFAAIIVLFLLAHLLAYFLERRMSRSREHMHGRAELSICERWESFKEWLANNEMPSFVYWRFNMKTTQETTQETNQEDRLAERLRERWDKWTNSYDKLERWKLGRIWRGPRANANANANANATLSVPWEGGRTFKVHETYTTNSRVHLPDTGPTTEEPENPQPFSLENLRGLIHPATR
jgi:hypothetical protein